MKHLLLLLSLLFIVGVEASLPFGSAEYFEAGLERGYTTNDRLQGLVLDGFLKNSEAQVLVKSQTEAYKNSIKKCEQKMSGNTLDSKDYCVGSFNKAINIFKSKYDGSVADIVISSAFEALKKIDSKGYTVER